MMIESTHLVAPYVGLTLAILFILWLWIQRQKERGKAEKFKTKYEKTLFHRKSSEVRLGKIGENLAPFVEGWPWDPKNFRFLGNPLDGIQFNKDEIIFVEIKTGNARLSRSQKVFRDLVKAGKVSFVTFKIKDSGIEIVREGEEA
jgi:predicted Holliday junction resolvase-like endonuclease